MYLESQRSKTVRSAVHLTDRVRRGGRGGRERKVKKGKGDVMGDIRRRGKGEGEGGNEEGERGVRMR